MSEDTHIIKILTENCQELYNYVSKGYTNVLQTIDEHNEEEEWDDSILRDEVVNAIYSLNHGKAAVVDNIPVAVCSEKSLKIPALKFPKFMLA